MGNRNYTGFQKHKHYILFSNIVFACNHLANIIFLKLNTCPIVFNCLSICSSEIGGGGRGNRYHTELEKHKHYMLVSNRV